MHRGRAALTFASLLGLLLFTGAQVGLSPHLVHHLFDHGSSQNECPFATAAERQNATSAPSITLVVDGTLVSTVAPPATPTPIDRRPASVDARSPPVGS
jgi:hypothetical protein